MKSKTTIHGAISIVNALATGKGSALGISLETTAEVLLTNENNIDIVINNDKSEDKTLAKECFKLVKPHSSESVGAKITVNSDDPPFFNATIAGEYKAMSELGFSNDQLLSLTKNALQYSFCDNEIKNKL